MIRAFLLFIRHLPPAPRAEWTEDDAAVLVHFLATPTGHRLLATLRAFCGEANERAAMRATAFDCGWACGYRALLAWFEALAASPRNAATPEGDPAEPGAPDHFTY